MGAIKHVICECEKKDHAKGKIRESCKYHERRLFVGSVTIISCVIICFIMAIFICITNDMELWVRQRFAYFILPLIGFCCVQIINGCIWMNYDNYCDVQKTHISSNYKRISCEYCNVISARNIDKTLLAISGLYYIVKYFKKKNSKNQ
jgi:hypothetical protein